MTIQIQNSAFSEKGFTLIEMIVVMTLIAVISTIGFINMQKWLPDMRLKDAAQDLYGYMQKARLGAAKTNSKWALTFDPANNTYSLISDWGGGNNNEGSIILGGYKSGVRFGHGAAANRVPSGDFTGANADNITYAGNNLVFNPLGSGSAGYVYLQHEDNSTTYAVGTQTTGVIKTMKWVGASWKQ